MGSVGPSSSSSSPLPEEGSKSNKVHSAEGEPPSQPPSKSIGSSSIVIKQQIASHYTISAIGIVTESSDV